MVRIGILPIVRFLADGGIPEWGRVGPLLSLARTDTLGDSSSRSYTSVDGEQSSPVEIEPSSKHCIGYTQNSMSATRRWRNLHLLIGRFGCHQLRWAVRRHCHTRSRGRAAHGIHYLDVAPEQPAVLA